MSGSIAKSYGKSSRIGGENFCLSRSAPTFVKFRRGAIGPGGPGTGSGAVSVNETKKKSLDRKMDFD